MILSRSHIQEIKPTGKHLIRPNQTSIKITLV